MPIYEFLCNECKKTFRLTLNLAEHAKGKFVCPKCNSKKVEQKVASFVAMTGKKS
jgi:putative FmdB family regulatory protein